MALQGTISASPTVKAQRLDKLPKEQQALEVQRLLTLRKQGSAVLNADPEPPIANLYVASSDCTAGEHMLSNYGGHQGLYTPEQATQEEQILTGGGNDFTKRWTQGEASTTAGFLSTTASPGQSTPAKLFSGFLPKNTESFDRKSHRRSVSAVTL